MLQVLLLAGVWALVTWAGVAGVAFPLPIMALVPLRAFVLPRCADVHAAAWGLLDRQWRWRWRCSGGQCSGVCVRPTTAANSCACAPRERRPGVVCGVWIGP